MSLDTPERWKIVRIIREDSPDVQHICEDEYDEKETIEYVLRYLSEKERFTQYDIDEELIFFPEVIYFHSFYLLTYWKTNVIWMFAVSCMEYAHRSDTIV